MSHWVKKGSAEDENGISRVNQLRQGRFTLINSILKWTFTRTQMRSTSSSFRVWRLVILANPDPDWTKDETDYLWSLCSDFDLRWIVIADRYEWEHRERTSEDLKDRYYNGVRKLLVGRVPESLMTASQLEQYNSYKWDKGYISQERINKQPGKSSEKNTSRICTNEHQNKSPRKMHS